MGVGADKEKLEGGGEVEEGGRWEKEEEEEDPHSSRQINSLLTQQYEQLRLKVTNCDCSTPQRKAYLHIGDGLRYLAPKLFKKRGGVDIGKH